MVLRNKSKRALGGRIMLALALGAFCHSMAYGAEHVTSYVNGGGKAIFHVTYFNPGDTWYMDTQTKTMKIIGPSSYTLSPTYKTSLESGLSYWAEMLGKSVNNTQPFQIMITTSAKDGNAYAGTWMVDYNSGSILDGSCLQQALQEGYNLAPIDPFDGSQPTGLKPFSVINIGEYLGAKKEGTAGGWYIDGETVLPNNEQAADYMGTVRHEMGHALGISAFTVGDLDGVNVKKDAYGNELWRFSDKAGTAATDWNMHLVDQNLNKAKPNMYIITNNYFNTVIKESNQNAKASDYFILDNPQTTAPYDNTNPRAGKLYFVGENVSQALNGATFDGVDGLPINPWEKSVDEHGIVSYRAELSHIQTPGMMSHVAYSNYTSFMEVELAVMQDLGYKLDRKNYYGFSEYGNNKTYINVNGYSARNADGTAYLPGVYNTTALGIGLHVYGSGNNITQAADILTKGDGAAGMRIDGASNTVTIDKLTNVKANGYRGIGALVAYGSNQTLNQYGTISAAGEKGVGVRFDFGSSSNGACDEYRGSYIRYKRRSSEETGAITSAVNIGLLDEYEGMKATPELNGALIKEYNLAGELLGTDNAIYIGKNAFVDKINALPGASITGNITSDWKKFNTDGSYDGVDGVGALQIQYNGVEYSYKAYIPDLVTKLNFAADLDYAGNITGEQNMKMNVNKATLNYSGTANIVSVNIDKGASLLGKGTYTVNDWTNLMPPDYSDAEMGQINNHGTFGATAGDVQVNGNLVSDGTLAVAAAYNGASVYMLQVNGTADISNNTLTVSTRNKPLLDRTYKFLTAGDGITGTIQTSALSDYVQAVGSIAGNDAYFKVQQTKGLSDTTDLNSNENSVADAFNATAPVKMVQDSAQAQQAANVFYNSSADMKKLMNSVAAVERTKLLQQTLTSDLTVNHVYDRLSSTFVDGKVVASIKVPSLTGEGQIIKTNLPLSLDTNNNFWLSMFRGFEKHGGTDGGGSLNNQTFGGVVGYDQAGGDNGRLGAFLSYGKTHYSADYLLGDSNDWRFGLYGGKVNGDWDYQGVVSYGANHYDLDATTWDSNAKLNSDYKAKIWDVGLKTKYTVPSTRARTWQIKPYGELWYTHINQDGYTETGNNVFAKNMNSASNNSTRAELGVEFKRSITPTTGWGGAIGYKCVLSGVNPELNGTFVDGTQGFTVRTENDRNYLTYNLNVRTSLGGRWTGQADIRGEKSSNNHKEIYSVMAKYSF